MTDHCDLAEQYEMLIPFAHRWLLPPHEIAAPNGQQRAEWIGAGAVVAAGWLESDRTFSKVAVCDFYFGVLYTVASRVKPIEQLPKDAATLFLAGFNWLLQFEVPGPEDTVH